MREPLFKISFRLSKMTAAEQCTYLIACINCERKGSSRRRELSHQLVDARTRHIKSEMPRKRKCR